ncbi:MAG: hypothetical protein AB7U81_05480 [Thiohalomonadaceae bacterium]
MVSVILATEDALSEKTAERLVVEPGGLCISSRIPGGGYGGLKRKLPGLLRTAEHIPVLLLTDLDKVHCAPTLINQWTSNRPLPNKMLLRVAVREVEAWLLADAHAMSQFLRVSEARFPRNPDDEIDPKRTLLELAKKAPRRIRDELLKPPYAIAAQGLGYNEVLGRFVGTEWSPERAAQRSPSLARTRRRIRELAAQEMTGT